MAETPTINDRPPNWRNAAGILHLKRCFACDPEGGFENWAVVVAIGQCAWCGWTEWDTDTREAPND